MEKENLTIEYPSLQLSYDAIKNTFDSQERNYSALTVKATFLWGSATAILGFILSTTLGQNLSNLGTNFLWLVSISLYLLMTVLCWFVTFPKRVYNRADIETIKDEFISLSPERFMVDMITHIQEASERNEKSLRWQAWAVRLSSILLLFQIGALIIWMFKIFISSGS